MKLALADFDRAVSMDAPLERLAATERFYAVILNGCGNPIIGELIQGLVARITFLRARSMSRSGRSRQSAIELWRMFDAIEKRQPETARKAAVEHVHAACVAAREAFKGASGADGQGAPAQQRPPRRAGKVRGKISAVRADAPRRKIPERTFRGGGGAANRPRLGHGRTVQKAVPVEADLQSQQLDGLGFRDACAASRT